MGRLGFNFVRSKEKSRDCECKSTLFDDNEDENDILSGKKLFRQYETSKKMYLLFFVSTTVVACFCIFVVVPQLIDYFTGANVTSNDTVTYTTQKQSVIEIMDIEKSQRNQERLEIMKKFNTLQESYKMLQMEFQKAKENYLKKLQNASMDEEKVNSGKLNETTQSSNGTESNDLEILDNETKITNAVDDKHQVLYIP